MTDAHKDRTAIGGEIVDAVRDGLPLGHRREVVVIDKYVGFAPPGTVVLEVADEFLFLGIDAYDGIAASEKVFPCEFDMLELIISELAGFGCGFARCGNLLLIDSQGITQVAQQRRDSIGADVYIKFAQLSCDALGGLPSPLHPAYRVACSCVHHQLMDSFDDFRRFFLPSLFPRPVDGPALPQRYG